MGNETISIRKLRMEEFDRLKPLFPDSDKKWNGYRRNRLEQFRCHDADTYIMEASGACVGELSANYSSRTLAEETVPQQRVYLDTFRLAEAYQGAGLGQRLLRYALDTLDFPNLFKKCKNSDVILLNFILVCDKIQARILLEAKSE